MGVTAKSPTSPFSTLTGVEMLKRQQKISLEQTQKRTLFKLMLSRDKMSSFGCPKTLVNLLTLFQDQYKWSSASQALLKSLLPLPPFLPILKGEVHVSYRSLKLQHIVYFIYIPPFRGTCIVYLKGDVCSGLDLLSIKAAASCVIRSCTTLKSLWKNVDKTTELVCGLVIFHLHPHQACWPTWAMVLSGHHDLMRRRRRKQSRDWS